MNEVIYPPCKKCGASHGMGIENMETGLIEPLNICKGCMFSGTIFKYDPHINIENNEKWNCDNCIWCEIHKEEKD